VTSTADSSASSKEEVLYQFRSDLIVTQQAGAFVIKDPARNSFARLGASEFLVAKQFDGRSTLEQICERLKTERDIILPVESARAFREKLRNMKLILAPGETVMVEEAGLKAPSGLLARLVVIPIPIRLDPDMFLTRLHHAVKDIFYRPAYVVFTIVAFMLAIQIWLDQWDLILRQSRLFGSLSSLVTYWVGFALSISAHEIAHGLTTKAFGGRVRRMGLFVYFGHVAFYTDVSDAWMFPSRLQQFLVVWAGAYTTLTITAVATIGWRLTVPGTLINEIFFVFMGLNAFAASFTLTPFFKGDGYYLLSTALDIPNLREKSFGYTFMLVRRYLLGKDDPLPKATPREARIFVLYATVTIAFLVVFSLWVAYSAVSWVLGRFEIWGLFLVLVILYDRVGAPFKKAAGGLLDLSSKTLRALGEDGFGVVADNTRRGLRDLLPKMRSAAPRVLAATVPVIGLMFVPYHQHVAAPFEVVALGPTVTSAHTSGVLADLEVHAKQAVKQGEVIAQIIEPRGLNRSFAERTIVRASQSGVVITSEVDLARRRGAFVRAGDPIVEILPDGATAAKIAISEHEASLVVPGQEILLRWRDEPKSEMHARVDEVEDVVEEVSGHKAVPVLSHLSGVGRPIGATGVAKIECGGTFFGLFLYERALRAWWVTFWSWF
jgi:hypothetical protein